MLKTASVISKESPLSTQRSFTSTEYRAENVVIQGVSDSSNLSICILKLNEIYAPMTLIEPVVS